MHEHEGKRSITEENIQRVLFELLPLQGEGWDGDGFYATDLTHPHPNP